MKHILISLIALILFGLILPTESEARYNLSGTSAQLVPASALNVEDNRVKVLEAYLKKHNSPLTPHARTFVVEADKNNLDWKLVASISGVESTFGKRIPYNSYNGWGWGIYGTNTHSLASWDDGIITISTGLRTRYMDKWGAKNVHEIGRYYASNPAWSQKVTYFMNSIESFENNMENTSLSISL